MKTIIIKVGNQKISFHGGVYKRCIFKNIDDNSKGEQYTFDCYLEHSKSARFWPYLKEQAVFDNVDVIMHVNKNVIDGCSEFRYLGQRHENNS